MADGVQLNGNSRNDKQQTIGMTAVVILAATFKFITKAMNHTRRDTTWIAPPIRRNGIKRGKELPEPSDGIFAAIGGQLAASSAEDEDGDDVHHLDEESRNA